MYLLKVHYVFTFIFICVIFPNVQCIRVNHSEAIQLCEDKGGLVNSSYFPRIEVPYSNIGQPRESVLYSQLQNVDLDDGKSAWVAGYVKYINKQYLHIGCPYIDLDRANVFAASDEHLGFYQCSQYCEYGASNYKDPDIKYFLILLQTIKCLCLRVKSLYTGSACFQPKTDVAFMRAPISRNVSALFGFFQCFYLLRTPKGNFERYTSKCLEKKHTICHVLENENYYVGNSSTWLRGVKECNRQGGIMGVPEASDYNMDINIPYWISLFRSYTIQTKAGDACLAVTRLGDQLVLEPDDCLANNSFICSSDIITNNSDTYAIPTFESSTINNQTHLNTTSTSATGTTTSKQMTSLNAITSIIQSSTSTGSKETEQLALGNTIIIALIVTASCLGVVAVAAITSLVYSRKRNANTERRQSNVAHENVAMNDNIVVDHVYHEYATIDDIVNIEESNSPVTLMNMTRVRQNETIDKERTGVCSTNTTTNMEKDATTFEPETIIHMSYKITNRTDLNKGASGDYNDDIKWYELLNGKQGKRDSHVYRGPLAAPSGRGPLMTNTNAVNSYRLSQGTLNIQKRDVSDTSASASEIYIEDVLLEKQLTNKREERDTYVF